MEINKKYQRPKCSHNKFKARCIECGGGSVCEHKKLKIYCKDCGGKAICEHNRIKYSCKECKGSAICQHNKRKRLCLDCKGSGICQHNVRLEKCKFCNFNNYLMSLQRDCVRRIIKTSTKFIKNKHTIEYLGCSIDYFKNFIYDKMTTEMNIDNIHLDHIKPVAAFDLNNENDLIECCHYTNFQPLLIEDNLKKSNKWSDIDELNWRQNIIFNDDFKQIYIPT